MHSQNNRRRLSPTVITLIALFVIAGISLYIRIALPYDQVFVHGSVWFRETDAYYHMRLVDNLLHHFPHRISFDPYTFYPHGTTVPWYPLFSWLVAGIAWLVGLALNQVQGEHIIDLVGAYTPAILGTLIVIPIYFIGKELFNRWVGVLSAALVAILPGEFLNRSLLGFTDHHVAESLFTTVTILFLILAVKKAKERKMSFAHLVNRNWAIITKPLIYTLLAGIFLGIYLLTWVGGLLLVFIIFAWLVIQFLIEHLSGKSTDYLGIIGVILFLIAFLMFVPILGKGGLETIGRISLIVAMITPLVLSGISQALSLTQGKSIKPVFYLAAVFGLGAISLAAFHAINPSLLNSMLSNFSVFIPRGAALTISEVHPILLPYGHFSLQIAWLNFTTAFFIAFISFGLLIYRNIIKESPDKTLFLVWSIIMLAAVLGQRRFGYYYAINAALLSGYFSWRILDFAGLRELLIRPKEALKQVQGKKAKKRAKARATQTTFLQPRTAWLKIILAGIIVFFLIFFPNIGKAKSLASGTPLINQSWHSSLLWLKDNSPEPFGDKTFYYELYETPFQYPETAYGIMSWWDYGHWITRIAHRIPISNPFQQGAPEAASFFTTQDEESANQMMNKLGSKYVIIDYQMPTAKFYAMPQFIGGSSDEFYGTYYQPLQSGKLNPVTLFYTTYYYSTVVRLYNFDGEATEPKSSTIVISYEEKLSQEGLRYNQITSSKSFSSYEEAEAYIPDQKSGKWRIVGTDPFTSPVPLEKMSHYELVYKSEEKWQGKPMVKIFEYSK